MSAENSRHAITLTRFCLVVQTLEIFNKAHMFTLHFAYSNLEL